MLPNLFDTIQELKSRIAKLEKFGNNLGSTQTITSTSPGNPGQIKYDSNNLYICVAANTWKKVALSSF